MKIIRDRAIRNETVVVDETEFRNCQFFDCRFSYSGGEYTFIDCNASNCAYDFWGAAGRTIAFCQFIGLLPKDSKRFTTIPKQSGPPA